MLSETIFRLLDCLAYVEGFIAIHQAIDVDWPLALVVLPAAAPHLLGGILCRTNDEDVHEYYYNQYNNYFHVIILWGCEGERR